MPASAQETSDIAPENAQLALTCRRSARTLHPMSTLRRMFYLSRATRPLTNDEVQFIQHISERNNRRKDITGCLMYSGGYFAQTLEGRTEILEPLVARIKADPRHTDLRILIEEDVTQRLCPDWSMGLIYSLDLADQLESLATAATFGPDEARDLMSRMKADTQMGSL
jgi:hypothetical protein